MIRLLLSLALLGVPLFTLAQHVKNDTTIQRVGTNGNNEIKVNMLMAILGAPEVSYERLLPDNMSIGASVLVGADKYNLDYNFAFTPYYRLYFGAKRNGGFFIEANASFASLTDTYYRYGDQNIRDKDEFNLGIGVAIGAKFLTKKGWIGEFYSGVGRYFNSSIHEMYPRSGITIGKRF